MSTAFIFNGFGQYEQKDNGEKGITLMFAGVPFWFPFGKVTPMPNYNFRELDQDKSTGSGTSPVDLTYMNVRIPGEKIADLMTKDQIPYSNEFRGIMVIKGKKTGKMIQVCEGRDADTGVPLFTEVSEVEATSDEVFTAETAAMEYKRQIIADYLQSKRDRLLGSPGKKSPDKMTRRFMDELGVEDIDDVSAHAKKAGIDPEVLKVIMQEMRETIFADRK